MPLPSRAHPFAAGLVGAGIALLTLFEVLPWAFVGLLGVAVLVVLPFRPHIAVPMLLTGVGVLVAMLVLVWLAWSGVKCASEVDGRLVEHDCGERPRGR